MTTIAVIDDLRSFHDGRDAIYSRTSAEGLSGLRIFHAYGTKLDELWLDHDLGWSDTIEPVVNFLLECVGEDRPFNVEHIYVHTGNPAAATRMINKLSAYYSVERRDALASGLVSSEW